MSEIRLSRRMAMLAPSSTIEVGRAAKTLAATGVDVVDLGLGEPDFGTPSFVAEAGIAAIRAGKTKYTEVAGDGALREAIAGKYRREQGAPCAAENVLVTAGAKQAIFNACQTLFEPGDEVAIFAPYWVSFPEIVRLSGAAPLFLATGLPSAWKPSVQELRERGTAKTRGVILNSPNNPTGAVVAEAELLGILEWCAEHRAYLLFDETYDRFLYGGAVHFSAARFREEHGDRIVVTGAASKTYAMTGWRLGWAVASKPIVSAMASFQSHSTSNASSISQEAARAALTDLERSDASISEMLAEYARRRAAILSGLSALDGVRCAAPEGAFYVFADVSALFPRKRVKSSVEFCARLLTEAYVAAVPGEAFGEDSCVRFSFATGLSSIEEGMRRLAAWAKEV